MNKTIKIPGSILDYVMEWEGGGNIQEIIDGCEGNHMYDKLVNLIKSSILNEYREWDLWISKGKTILNNPKTGDYFLGDLPGDNPLQTPDLELYFNKFNPSEDTIEITYDEYNDLKDIDNIVQVIENNLWNENEYDGGTPKDMVALSISEFTNKMKLELHKLYNRKYD